MLDEDKIVAEMRAMRRAAGLRQCDVGSTHRVCDFENGRRPLSLFWLKAYAEALNMPISYFVSVGE